MADTQISDFVWVLDGATSTEIANATTAINAMSTDIDTLLVARTNLWFRHASAMPDAPGGKAWGDSPPGRTSQINRDIKLIEQRYASLHELGHHVDRDKLNKAKRSALQAIMNPPGNGWNAGAYLATPNECYGDSFPRAYAPATITRSNGKLIDAGLYDRQVPSGSLATYISITEGAGAPASTALAAASLAGATNIKYTSITGSLVADDYIAIDTGANIEVVQVTAVGTSGSGGTGITFTPALLLAHSNGTAVVETTPSPPGGPDVIDVVVAANTANGAYRSHTFTGLELGSTGTAQMRFYDGQVWGPWSDPLAVALEVTPGRPTSITVTPGTLTPDFGASLNSPDPDDYITHYFIEVEQFISGDYVVKMLHDEDTVGIPNRVSIPYDGNVGGPLAWDQTYQFIINLTNKYGVTVGMAAFLSFTPTLDAGPIITIGGNPADIATKIDTETPIFNIAHRTGANIDEARLRVWDNTGVMILWDSGVIGPFTAAASHDVTVPADVLVWGMNVRVSALVRADGDLDFGVESEQHAVHVNAQPGAPAPISVRSDTAQVVKRADGVWVFSEDTPILVFPYRDTDRDDLGYVDDPSRREIELLDLSDADVGASPYVITSSITDEWQVTTGLLDADTTFKARARYDDDADVRSAWSAYLLLRYSEPPVLSAVTPADLATVTDPTPTFTWAYASPSDKAQASYRLVLSVGTDEVYNSGLVATTDLFALVPPILDTAVDVDWILSVYDSDGLYGRAIGTFTTAFVTPDALTGLTVTPDPASDSIVVEWDASIDPDFYTAQVYVRPADGQFSLVAIITDPSIVAYSYFAAAHNRETTFRVTQSNGFAESAAAEGSATLGGDESSSDFIHGCWLTRSDVAVELPNAKPSTGDTQTELEVFSPPGRGEKVVLNWGTTGYEGDVGIFTQDRALLLLLRDWKENSVVSIFKTSYGAVRYVRLMRTPDTDEPAGWISGTISYIEVSSSAASF